MSLFRPTTSAGWRRPATDPFSDPFRDFDPLQIIDRTWQNLLPTTGRGTTEWSTFDLPVDILENNDSYDVFLDLPGYLKESVDIKISNGILTVSADKNDYADPDKLFRRERSVGKVKRSVRLPSNASQDNIRASLENGVLNIKIPKLGGAAMEKKVLIS